jgi:hypothetical protein
MEREKERWNQYKNANRRKEDEKNAIVGIKNLMVGERERRGGGELNRWRRLFLPSLFFYFLFFL